MNGHADHGKMATGHRRLRRVACTCRDDKQRVRNSACECEVEPAFWATRRAGLVAEIDAKKNSLHFYCLGAEDRQRFEHLEASCPWLSTALALLMRDESGCA